MTVDDVQRHRHHTDYLIAQLAEARIEIAKLRRENDELRERQQPF
jgi:hypothetical protein